MLVEDYMTKNVEYVGPNLLLKAAAEKMRIANVGILPVCEKGELLGTLTDRDIVVRAVSRGMDPNTARVRDVMSKSPACARDDQEINSAAKMMENQRVRRLPVLDQGNRLVGILSVTDFTREDEGRRIIADVIGHVAAQHV